MGYQGYEQILCKNGHYYQVDCYEWGFSDGWKCSVCGAGVGWFYAVDQTNGPGEPFDLFPYLEVPAVLKTCLTCEHKEMATPDVYNIPDEGRRDMSNEDENNEDVQETYSAILSCKNCRFSNEFDIPKGSTKEWFVKDQLCPCCGCNTLA